MCGRPLPNGDHPFLQSPPNQRQGVCGKGFPTGGYTTARSTSTDTGASPTSPAPPAEVENEELVEATA